MQIVKIEQSYYSIFPTTASKLPYLGQWLKKLEEVINDRGIDSNECLSVLSQLKHWANLDDNLDLAIANEKELFDILNAIAIVNFASDPASRPRVAERRKGMSTVNEEKSEEEQKPQKKSKKKGKDKKQTDEPKTHEEYAAYQIAMLVNAGLCPNLTSALKIADNTSHKLLDNIISDRVKHLNQGDSEKKEKEEKEEEIMEEVINELHDGSFFEGFGAAVNSQLFVN